ncbi:MAG TPA: DUF997 family protein [Thermoguttaceae bacterium]|nr:DUF997 family protein [Thermoguttaceae bacterium]
MSRSTPPENRDQLDTVVVHARREALAILVAFAVCLVWSIGWSHLAGYGEPVDGGLATVLGMPGWVFGGVLVPWLAADLFGLWFCFFFMADDPLGESEDEGDEDGSGEADAVAAQPPTAEEGRHA